MNRPRRRQSAASTQDSGVTDDPRSDRPVHARDQYLQPGADRHGADPAPRLSSRKRDPAGVSRHPLGLGRDVRGGRQIRLEPGPPGLGQPQPVGHRHRRRVRDDRRNDPRRRRQTRARSTACCCICMARWSPKATRTPRANCWRGCARQLGPSGADRRHPRPARQRHPENGRQCQRADRLPHLSAYRHVRARLAGRRIARTRDARRDPAADRDRPPADDLRSRPRPPPERADGRTARPRRGCSSSAARRSAVSICAGFSRSPISTMSARR